MSNISKTVQVCQSTSVVAKLITDTVAAVVAKKGVPEIIGEELSELSAAISAAGSVIGEAKADPVAFATTLLLAGADLYSALKGQVPSSGGISTQSAGLHLGAQAQEKKESVTLGHSASVPPAGGEASAPGTSVSK